MNQISCKIVRTALKIVVHRDDEYKITSITLLMGRGYPRISRIKWRYFGKEAQDYILKEHPMILSPVEIELL